MIRAIVIIVSSILIAFMTSTLLSLCWIKREWIREGLVYFTIVVELLSGFFILRSYLQDQIKT